MDQEAQADESTGEVQEGEDSGGVPVIADGEFAKANHPRLRTLHDPSEATESLAGVNARPSDAWSNATPPQRLTVGARGVRFIRVQLGWAPAGPTGLADRSADWPDRIDQRLEEFRVVDIGGRELHGQGHALPIHQEVVLAARFGSISRVRPVCSPPRVARTLMLSTLARLQSMAPLSPSQLRTTWCTVAQMPSSCHWRTRRQQVTPLP